LPRSHSHNKDFLDLRGDSRVGTNARPGIPEVEWHRLTRFLPLYVVRARDKRRQRERFYLALYILILGNTGIRVGEALRWRDVSTTRTLTDEVRAILSVRGRPGNVRWSVTRGSSATWMSSGHSGPRSWGFAHRTRNTSSAIPQGHRSGPSREASRGPSRKPGSCSPPTARSESPYSLRHTYATMRLAEGVSVFQLAANMGTSVEMLEEFYGKKRMRDPKTATEVTKNRSRERIT
jgi:integrase